MALVDVSCPGCQVTLKATAEMAGKRVKCKKCDTRFVIPGAAPAGESAGDSQMLSALDLPAAAAVAAAPAASASTFDFGSMLDAPPAPPKKSAAVPKPEPRPEPKAARAPAPPPPPAAAPQGDFDFFNAEASPSEPPPKPKAADAPKAKSIPKAPPVPPPAAAPQGDFDFLGADASPSEPLPKPKAADAPKAKSVPQAPPVPPPPAAAPQGDFDFLGAEASPPEPPPKPKAAAAPKAKSVPQAPPVPAEPPKAKSAPQAPSVPSKPPPKAAAPAAAPAGGFDFGAMLDEPSEAPSPDGFGATNDDDDVPQAESVSEGDGALSLDDELAEVSDDPFGFPGGDSAADVGPPSTRGKAKAKGKAPAKDAKGKEAHAGGRHSRYQQSSGGGKMKLIVAGVGVLLLGAAIAGVAIFVNKKKGEPAQAGKSDDKDAKGEGGGEATKNDPTPPPPDAKNATPGKKDPTKKDPPKKDPTGKPVAPMVGGSGPPQRATLTLPNTMRSITLQMPKPKPELFVERNGALPIDAEFAKVRRLIPPGRADADIGILWEREGVPNVPGNKLVMDVCRPSGTRQYSIEFSGDGKPVPAADLSDDGRWFAHGDGSKVTVWKAEDQTKLVDAWDVYAALPAQQKAGLAAVYFPMPPKEKRDMPPDRLATVATDGTVHLWDLSTKMAVGTFAPPHAYPGRVVEGRGVALSQSRTFAVVAVGGDVFKVSFDFDGVNATMLADLGADVTLSLGVATYGETTVYAFETGTDKKERAVMLLNRGSKGPKSYRWPDAVGAPVGAGWISSDLVAVSTNRGGVVLFDYNDENTSFLPRYAMMPADEKALHATTDVCHWYLIPNAADAKKCMLVQISPPGGTGLLDEPNKAAGVPLGRLDVRGLLK